MAAMGGEQGEGSGEEEGTGSRERGARRKKYMGRGGAEQGDSSQYGGGALGIMRVYGWTPNTVRH